MPSEKDSKAPANRREILAGELTDGLGIEAGPFVCAYCKHWLPVKTDLSANPDVRQKPMGFCRRQPPTPIAGMQMKQQMTRQGMQMIPIPCVVSARPQTVLDDTCGEFAPSAR